MRVGVDEAGHDIFPSQINVVGTHHLGQRRLVIFTVIYSDDGAGGGIYRDGNIADELLLLGVKAGRGVNGILRHDSVKLLTRCSFCFLAKTRHLVFF